MSIPYQKILVPLDGSNLAVQALPHAEEIARGVGANLILCRVVEVPAGFVVAPAGMGSSGPSVGIGVGTVGAAVMLGDAEGQRQALDEAKAYLDRLAASLQHRKIDTAVDINTGDPATRIVDYAAANAVDLIVMSTHGRSGIGRWAYGSVANKVLQAAPCAVLVVRPTDGQ
jgi:nucleotide-binding universal stress UspA family protein